MARVKVLTWGKNNEKSRLSDSHSLVLENLKTQQLYWKRVSFSKGVCDPVLFCCIGNKVIAHVALGSRCI